MKINRERILSLLPHLLLIGAAFVLYAESFGHQWTMDDHIVVARNLDIRSWAGFLNNSYPGRPIRELTYLLDYHLFGLEPAGYHIQNILWHGLNASLLIMVVRTLGGSLKVAWLAGLLFLVDPLNVEVVANISHRKDSLMLLFVQLALLLILRCYRETALKKKVLWGGLGGWVFGIACLAKQSAAGLLPLILGYELTISDFRRRLFLRNRLTAILGLVGVLVFLVVWYLWAWRGESFQLKVADSLALMEGSSEASRKLYLLTIFKSLAFMFLRLIWPFNLAMEYVYTVPKGWLDPWVLSGLGILLGTSVCMFLLRRILPLATIGIVWMLAFWLPVSNLLWPLAYFAADRYMYAVCAGFSIMVAALVVKLFARSNVVLYCFSGLLLLGLGTLTWQQNRVWSDEMHLFQQAAKVSPGSTKAVMGLGLAYMNAGQLVLAKKHLEKSALGFNDSGAFHLLGQLHEKLGNRQQSLRYYQRFVMINEPKYSAEVLEVKRLLKLRYGVSF